MARLGDLVVAIGANTRDFDQKLGKSMRKMRNFGKTMKQMGQNMTRNVSLPILAVAGGAVKAASDLETLQTSFISLAGGAEQAGALMNELNEFTAKTPFQIEQVGNAARQLIASGTGIEDVNTQLQFLGDIAATSGSSIEEIAAIFSKVNAKGKVELENLNQLAERGIPIFTALSEATGLPADALGAGAVSVEQFNDVLSSFAKEGGFAAGAMERLSETAAGKLSTALDNLKLAGAELVKSLMPVLKDVIDRVTQIAQRFANLDDHQKKMILTVGLVVAAIGPLVTVIMSMSQAFVMVRTAVLALNTAMLANPFALFAGAIALVVGGLIAMNTEASEAKTAIDDLKTANEGLTKAEQERNITAQMAEQKKLVAELKEEADAKQALVDQGYGGKAIKDAREASEAYNDANAELHQMSNMLFALDAKEPMANLANNAEDAADAVERLKKAIPKEHTIGFLLSGQEEMSEQVQTERGMARAEGRPGKEHTLGFLFGQQEAQSMEVALQRATEAHAEAVDAMRAKQEPFMQSVKQLAGTLQGAFSNLFRGLIEGTQTFGEFMRQVLIDLLVKLASMAAAFLVISALIPGGGAALGGFGKFMKAGFGLTGFADGGIVSGPTAALVGEYAGARTNPEVIAPLDKLQAMIQGAGGGNVTVTGRLSGRDILLSSERSNFERNRVRGF
jgi:tape measure domain-containing protein